MPLPLRVLCSSPRPCACLIMPASDISRTIMQNTIIPAQMKHACLCPAPASCSPVHPSHCTPTLLHCLQDTTAQISMDRTCASLPGQCPCFLHANPHFSLCTYPTLRCLRGTIKQLCMNRACTSFTLLLWTACPPLEPISMCTHLPPFAPEIPGTCATPLSYHAVWQSDSQTMHVPLSASACTNHHPAYLFPPYLCGACQHVSRQALNQ